MSTTTERTAVRFGRFSRGVFHLVDLPVRTPGEFHRAADYVALCGRDGDGLSPVIAKLEHVSALGSRVCAQCARRGMES